MQQKHPSLVWIRTPCQQQFVTPCHEPVFLASECLNYGQFPSVLLMSPKRLVVAPIPETVVRYSHHHKRRLSNLPIPVGITRPNSTSASSDPVERAEPDNPSEAVGDPGRRSHQKYPRRGRRGGVRNGYRTRGQSSGRARLRQAVGHLMSCSSSATSASLLEHRVLRTLAARKLYQQTLEHFLRSLPVLEDTQMDTALTIYSNAQYMFGVQHHRINTLMAALMHRYHPILKTRRWQALRRRSCTSF